MLYVYMLYIYIYICIYIYIYVIYRERQNEEKGRKERDYNNVICWTSLIIRTIHGSAPWNKDAKHDQLKLELSKNNQKSLLPKQSLQALAIKIQIASNTLKC